jgi:methionine-rich copper-binding protein CopC
MSRSLPALFSILAVLALLPAGPLHAHAMLKRASPAAGTTAKTTPNEVVLTFSEKLEPKFSSIEVRDAKGVAVQAGKAQGGSKATELRVPLKPLAPGAYKVIWRVLSVDTHRSEGSFTFRIGP